MGDWAENEVFNQTFDTYPYTTVGYDQNVSHTPQRGTYGYGNQNTPDSSKVAYLQEFSALMEKARQSGLAGRDQDRFDFLWDELGIPGDYKGTGFLGNTNPLEYIDDGSGRGGVDEIRRKVYLDRMFQQFGVDFKTGKLVQPVDPNTGKPIEGVGPGLQPVEEAPQESSLIKDAADYRARSDAAATRPGAQMDRAQWDADRALDLQSRAGLQQTEGMWRDMAMGKGPSAAQAQFQSALDQTNRNAMSLANSARGGQMNRALAQSNAQNQAGLANAAAAAQSAALRAQEMQQAMTGLSSTGQALRTGDLARTGDARQFAASQAAFNDAAMQRNDLMQKYWLEQGIGAKDKDYAQRIAQRDYLDKKRQMDLANRINQEMVRHGRAQESTQLALGALEGATGGAMKVATGGLMGGK